MTNQDEREGIGQVIPPIEVRVALTDDYLERIARTSVHVALRELIWNALDADATTVKAEFERGGALGGISGLRVVDDGHGMTLEEAQRVFTALGESWKESTRKSQQLKRILHGHKGEGRFRAFALGDVAWRTLAQSSEPRREIVISGVQGSRGVFRIEQLEMRDAAVPSGTIVAIASPVPGVEQLLKEDAFAQLCGEFGPYLRMYPGVHLELDGVEVSAGMLIAQSATSRLERIDLGEGRVIDIDVEILEWTPDIALRKIYLCDEEGFAHHVVPGSLSAFGLNYSVYAKSAYFKELADSGGFMLEELDGQLQVAIKNVKDELRKYLRRRHAEEQRGRVEAWKNELVYPYTGDPSSTHEAHERQMFDIVAANVEEFLPGFEKGDSTTRRLSFRLLRQALQDNPASLNRIIAELVELPKDRQDALAALLEYTSLSHIIQASKMVADRLNFIHMLNALLFDADSTKRLKERSQLHRLLAANTWIFHERYNLMVDDSSLTQLLRKHLETDERSVLVEGEVLRDDGTRGIIDLAFGRALRSHGNANQENLVIELKRPSVKVSPSVLDQIESYAFAIMEDPRFDKARTRWTFLAVSNELEERARIRANQSNRPPGLVIDDRDGRFTVWAKTWTELIADARSGLDFVNSHLEYKANDAGAWSLLSEKYAELFAETGIPASRLGEAAAAKASAVAKSE